MSAIQTLTDANWQDCIGNQAALILLTTGDGLRGDFSTQFKTSAEKSTNIIFARLNPSENPEIAKRFDVHEKPVMLAYWAGEVLARRVRPWASDVILALELLTEKQKEQVPLMSDTLQNEEQIKTEAMLIQDTPVHVSDADFQEAVVDYSQEMPVLVDFWAEWCGPCRMVAPIMEKLAKDYAGKVRIAKVDTDANPGLSQSFRIMSIPTIMIFKEGHLVFSQPGAFPEAAFRDLLDQVIALDIKAAMAAQAAAEATPEENSQN